MIKKLIQLNKGITNLTRGVVCLMAFAVFSICAILLPEIAREEKAANPQAGAAWPFVLGAWILSLPIFAALWETLKILNYIDRGTAFSNLTVIAIQNIKKYALIYAAMIIIAALSIVIIGRLVDPSEDMPPILMFGTILSLTSIVIATFAATCEKLLKDALKMKEENELTI